MKEIATDRLNDKLRESLGSELAILKRTRHENIVSFYDIVKVGGEWRVGGREVGPRRMEGIGPTRVLNESARGYSWSGGVIHRLD